MLRKIKSILFYGGTSKKEIEQVFEDITWVNRSNLLVFGSLTVIAMGLMAVVSVSIKSLAEMRWLYSVICVMSLILLVVVYKCTRKDKAIIFWCVYLFMGVMHGFGILLGTVVSPETLSVSFSIMIIVMPLLFVDYPVRILTSTVFGITVYVIVAYFTQSPYIFEYNLTNVIPYGIASMIVTVYLMSVKLQSFVYMDRNKRLMEIDQLTGLYNRRSYEEKFSELSKRENSEGIALCVCDVCNLKYVNDLFGHFVGDSIIRGTAGCIERAFGKYGRCYCTGGDKFVVILEGTIPEEAVLREALVNECEAFDEVDGIVPVVAMGMAIGGKGKSIVQLVMLADKAMYQDKEKYDQNREE